MKPIRVLLATVVLALALAISACGESDSDQVKSTIQDYIGAVASGDGEKACGLVTEQTKASIEQAGRPCAATIKSLSDGPDKRTLDAFDDTKVEQVKVTGDKATATIELGGGTTQPVSLVKVEGDWRINTGGTAAQ